MIERLRGASADAPRPIAGTRSRWCGWVATPPRRPAERSPVVNRSRGGEAISRRIRPSRRRAMGGGRVGTLRAGRFLSPREPPPPSACGWSLPGRATVAVDSPPPRFQPLDPIGGSAHSLDGFALAPIRLRFFRLQGSAAAPAGDAGGQRHLTDDRGSRVDQSTALTHQPRHGSASFPRTSTAAASAAARGNCAHTRVGPSAARTTPQRSLSICTRFRPMPPPLSGS